jgi:hypothetical protein
MRHAAWDSKKETALLEILRVPTKEFSRARRAVALLSYYRPDPLPGAGTCGARECRTGNPWRKRTGRPRSLGLYRPVEAAFAYLRHNATQEFIGDMRDASQPTISRYLAALVSVIGKVLQEFVPSAGSAAEAVQGRGCLVDGTIAPC